MLQAFMVFLRDQNGKTSEVDSLCVPRHGFVVFFLV